jgi:subtilase-type serine protease
VPLAQLNQLQAPAFITALDQMSGENIVDVSTSALLAQRQFIDQVMRQGRLSHGSDQEWSLWASGYAESGHLNGDANAHRFNGGVSGMAAGLEYRVSESFRLGAAGGIGISHFNVAGGLGTGRMAYKQIAGTAGYDRGALYIDAMFGGAFGEGTTQRNIVLPGLVSSAAGHINSSQVMGSFEVGYGLSLEEAISMTPFARLETGSVDQDGFSETGAGTLNLAAPAQSAGSTESLLGARFGTGVPVGTMLVSADVTLGWRHQLGGRGRTGRLSFAGVAGTDFTIAGASLMGDAADVGAGLSTAISDTGAAWVHYDGDYAGSGTSHAITVGLRFSW